MELNLNNESPLNTFFLRRLKRCSYPWIITINFPNDQERDHDLKVTDIGCQLEISCELIEGRVGIS